MNMFFKEQEADKTSIRLDLIKDDNCPRSNT